MFSCSLRRCQTAEINYSKCIKYVNYVYVYKLGIPISGTTVCSWWHGFCRKQQWRDLRGVLCVREQPQVNGSLLFQDKVLCFVTQTVHIYISDIFWSVCLSLCLRSYVWNPCSKLHQIFCACYLWLWLGLHLAALRYVMYFQFRGQHHDFPIMDPVAQATEVTCNSMIHHGFDTAAYTQSDSPEGSTDRAESDVYGCLVSNGPVCVYLMF